MEFVSDDVAAQTEPTDDELHAYLQSHPDAFRVQRQFTFAFSPEARAAFHDERQEAKIVIDHPRYQAQTVLSPETRHALAAEL